MVGRLHIHGVGPKTIEVAGHRGDSMMSFLKKLGEGQCARCAQVLLGECYSVRSWTPRT
jgi:hypothetical protein